MKLKKYLGVFLVTMGMLLCNCGIVNAVSYDKVPVIAMKDDRGYTLLHNAVKEGNKGMVKVLLENGVDVNAVNSDGDTPLHVAVKRKNVDKKMVDILIKNGADVNAADRKGYIPIEYIFDEKYCLDRVDGILFESNFTEDIFSLKERFIGEILYEKNDKVKLLHVKNRLYILGLLLEKGADLNKVGDMESCFENVMEFMSEHEVTELFKVLLKSEIKLDVNRKFGDRTLAYYIYSYGNKDTIMLLNKSDYMEDCKDLKSADVMFVDAVFRGDKKKIKLAVRRGADINMNFVGNQTALHIAAFRDKKDIVELLLSLGADADIKNGDDMTALHIACERGNKGILKLLLKHSATR